MSDDSAIKRGGDNLFADLKFPDADTHLLKAQLVSRMADIIGERKLTQVEAAKLLGLTQPKVSAMLRGQFRGFSERKLIDCLTSLGRDVQIVIKESPQRRAGGKRNGAGLFILGAGGEEGDIPECGREVGGERRTALGPVAGRIR